MTATALQAQLLLGQWYMHVYTRITSMEEEAAREREEDEDEGESEGKEEVEVSHHSDQKPTGWMETEAGEEEEEKQSETKKGVEVSGDGSDSEEGQDGKGGVLNDRKGKRAKLVEEGEAVIAKAGAKKSRFRMIKVDLSDESEQVDREWGNEGDEEAFDKATTNILETGESAGRGREGLQDGGVMGAAGHDEGRVAVAQGGRAGVEGQGRGELHARARQGGLQVRKGGIITWLGMSRREAGQRTLKWFRYVRVRAGWGGVGQGGVVCVVGYRQTEQGRAQQDRK